MRKGVENGESASTKAGIFEFLVRAERLSAASRVFAAGAQLRRGILIQSTTSKK